MVICLERGADLHMVQLMPLPVPLTVSCLSKIQIGFTFLVPAHLGSPGQRAIKWVCGGGQDPPTEMGNFGRHLPAHCKYGEYPACSRYSQPYLVGGNSDVSSAATCC